MAAGFWGAEDSLRNMVSCALFFGFGAFLVLIWFGLFFVWFLLLLFVWLGDFFCLVGRVFFVVVVVFNVCVFGVVGFFSVGVSSLL